MKGGKCHSTLPGFSWTTLLAVSEHGSGQESSWGQTSKRFLAWLGHRNPLQFPATAELFLCCLSICTAVWDNTCIPFPLFSFPLCFCCSPYCTDLVPPRMEQFFTLPSPLQIITTVEGWLVQHRCVCDTPGVIGCWWLGYCLQMDFFSSTVNLKFWLQ